MGEGRRELIVNLSGDQKKVLGFASWTQVSITAVGIILGSIIFTFIRWILTLLGTKGSVAVVIGAIFFAVIVAPFAIIAFRPIRDKQGNLLYYMNKQLIIDYEFERREIGTYLNLQEPKHPVNQRLPYALTQERDE
ncbi:hypothetical protein FOD75_11330 (plasmid) [Limosilactobacillus reuteri]|uniref:PrgI family protein n=1 Tax=Limosilactobacillus reuteri TaxID=1598 RepID=A0A517D8L3_LIMRT|nr:hypothetical protein [Limosilactobacillus reuteri]QDR73676.1 hypothetical protein FOD75_11330 [Limosilactobacillus reuteri]